MAEGVVGPGMPGKAPSGERAAFWRTVIGEWSSSGQTKVAFCKVRGLSPSAFHWWKGELARRDAAQGKRSASGGTGFCDEVNGSSFVPLRVVTMVVAGRLILALELLVSTRYSWMESMPGGRVLISPPPP